ncbi:MAG: SH3-like domain-containing protein [Spirochaetia bacterium]|nr:SH3-like domain-containing protein [Spirochaetia bacterium]
MKKVFRPLVLALAVFAMTGFVACKKSGTVIVERVNLVEKPGEKQPRYVANALLQRGEIVKILEEKSVDGTTYYQVQLEGVETKGWLEARWLKEGKLEQVTITRDSDVFQRPNDKAAKVPTRARAGQVAFKISTSGDFVQIQYPGVEGYVKKSNLGDGSIVVRTVSIPGLGTATVSASSQYKRADGTETEFDPRNLFDGSLQTAWCEGKADDDGIGESITLNFESPVSINKVEVVNGWARSEELYEMNNRVSALKVKADSGSATVQLQDKNYDYQTGEPMMLTGNTFTFVIDGVHKGRDKDTCISEIRLSGGAFNSAN